MTNPTRQEMLSAIDMKIARTWWGTWPWDTGYYLPVMIGDILKYVDTHCFWEDDCRSFDGNKKRNMEEIKDCIVCLFYHFVWRQDEPIEKQDLSAIQYVYSLIPTHD